MAAITDYGTVGKYFDYEKNLEKAKRMQVAWFCISLVAFIASTVITQVFWVVFLFCLLIFGYFVGCVLSIETPSDGDIEDTFTAYAESLIPRAIQKFNVDDTAFIHDPDHFWYISSFSAGEEVTVEEGESRNVSITKRYREGKDGVWRANTRGVAVLMYAEDMIMSYDITHCIENGAESMETTTEHYFEEVAGIEVDSKKFTLKFRGGGNKTFPLSHVNESCTGPGDEVINGIRSMIREKKRNIRDGY